ncbi:hypothetical protein Tco_1503117 [Tanacetum coccineum]
MRTRSQSRNQNRPQQQAPPVVVDPFKYCRSIDIPLAVNHGPLMDSVVTDSASCPARRRWIDQFLTYGLLEDLPADFMKRHRKSAMDLLREYDRPTQIGITSELNEMRLSRFYHFFNPEIASLKLSNGRKWIGTKKECLNKTNKLIP